MKYKSLREHIKFAMSAFKKRGEFYRRRGLELSPTVHTFLWQNRRYIIDITTRAMLALFKLKAKESPALTSWRAISPRTAEITRHVQKVLVQRRNASLSRLATEAEESGSREAVRRCLKIGVDLGLLHREGDAYSITDLYADELFSRSILRLRHPDIVEFARVVMALHNLEQMVLDPKYPRDEDHPLTSPLTITEAIAAGHYEEE